MALPALYYTNRFADATPVASSTASGFAAANVADWRPYTWWKPTALPATLTVDCATARPADYALVYGHTLFSSGCAVQVRGSTDNFSASDVLVASLTPASDDPFLITFGSVSYRYWRLTVTGAATMPALAICSIGTALQLPTGLPESFDPIGRKVDGQSNRSENGQPLGRVVDFEQWKQSVRLQRVTWAWVRDTWLPAWRAHLRSTPFVFGWDPGTYPADLKLVTAGEQFSTPHMAGGRADLTVELKGVVT